MNNHELRYRLGLMNLTSQSIDSLVFEFDNDARMRPTDENLARIEKLKDMQRFIHDELWRLGEIDPVN